MYETVSWGTVLRSPKTPNHSLPILVVEIYSELRENKFVEHFEVRNSVYISVQKIRSHKQPIAAECCPDSEFCTGIIAFKVKAGG